MFGLLSDDRLSVRWMVELIVQMIVTAQYVDDDGIE